MEKFLSTVYTAFLFMGHSFWKENIQDSTVTVIGINQGTMADLRKIGPKVRE